MFHQNIVNKIFRILSSRTEKRDNRIHRENSMMYIADEKKKEKEEQLQHIRFPSSLAFTARSSFPATTTGARPLVLILFRDRNRVIIRRKWERRWALRTDVSARSFSYRKTHCLREFNRELCRNNSQCALGRNWRLLQSWGNEKKHLHA